MKYNSQIFTKKSATYFDEDLRQYMLSIYQNMTIALGISALVAYIIGSSESLAFALYGTPIAYLIMLSPVIYVFFFTRNILNMTTQQARFHLATFAALNGMSLGVIFLIFTKLSIVKTFLLTSATFGGMSLYGYTTKKDLTSIASFVYMGLIGLIIVSLVNLFLRSSSLDFAISLIGIAIFTVLTAFDTQKLKTLYYTMHGNNLRASNIAVYGALTLYLDFINLFTFLLHFLGHKKED